MSPFQAYPLMWMITKISTPSNNQCPTWRQMVKIRGVRLMAAARNKLTTYARLSLCSFVLTLIFAPLRPLLLLFMRHQSPQLWRKHPSGSSSFNACNALDFLTTEHPKVMSTLPISSSSTHGYGSNTVSVPLVRRHVTRCLKAARQECNKELQRVTNAITSFFEEKLHEVLHDAFVLQQGAESRNLLLRFSWMNASSDGGYEAEPEGNHSRQSSLASSSPGVIRRQATISWDKKPAPSPPSAPNSAVRSFQAGEGTTSPLGANHWQDVEQPPGLAWLQLPQLCCPTSTSPPHSPPSVGRPVSFVHSDRLATGGSEKETDTEGKAKKWKVVVPLIPLVKGPC
ncbi:hypothetical protein F5888DRAFT_1637753 [Russula emetica]|nr:hypothetical protein F5888DRAFT_1637753 [Russula emetica]